MTNRSFFRTCGLVGLLVAVAGIVPINNTACGCLLLPQAESEATLQLESSRRMDGDLVDGDLEAALEEPQLDRPQPDSSESNDRSNELSIDGAEEAEASKLSIDEAESDDEESDDEDLDDDLKDDSREDRVRSQIAPTAISTDTRLLRVNIAESNATSPSDQSGELIAQSAGRALVVPSEKRFAWAAPDIRYQPLYFEEVAHERYGQTPEGCEIRQTVLSAAHFFGSAALLPYKLLDQHPQSCDGPLGFCRPGSKTPFVWQRPIVR